MSPQNCITPVRILRGLIGPLEAGVRSLRAHLIPLALGTEEVTHVVAFLAARMTGFVTGARIDVSPAACISIAKEHGRQVKLMRAHRIVDL